MLSLLRSNTYLKQEEFKNNNEAAVKNLIKLLDMPVSAGTINTIKLHPNYPSLSSISDTLVNWGIENLAINSMSSKSNCNSFTHLHLQFFRESCTSGLSKTIFTFVERRMLAPKHLPRIPKSE